MKKSAWSLLVVLFIDFCINISSSIACTVIVVGKKASTDGSVIISQTDCGENCRIQVIHGKEYPSGEQAPIYWGIQEIRRPLDDFGEVIGQIPQVEKTYTYFHSAYPHMNEHQLSFAESTMDQREELYIERKQSKQIMTIEQAMALALQRCKTAKSALALVTSLMDHYGFLPSSDGESESVCIADPNEIWLLEVCSTGPGWDPDSGEPGAIWAAQRIPDNHVFLMPNQSLIREIDIADTSHFKASSNYMKFAIDKGWYDPAMGNPFIWQEAYSPPPHEWATSRLWLFYSTVAPNLKKWPDRTVTDEKFMRGYDAYHEMIEPISIYPFSVEPENKLSVKDVITFQRSYFAGTIYDKTLDIDWLVPDGRGSFKKSPLTTPFPTKDMRELIDITSRRNVAHAHCYYGMIAQLRDWLPDTIGGVYWVFLDNPYVSPYVPIYAGTQKIADCYKTYHPDKFDPNSARWAIDFVDNLMYLSWQQADKDLKMVQQTFEDDLFRKQAEIEEKAKELFEEDPQKANIYLTEYTTRKMDEILKLYTNLRFTLIEKYSNNVLDY
jgi:dipeptidase